MSNNVGLMESYLARLARDAADEHGVPEDVAEAAARVTAKNLSIGRGLIDQKARRRARKYFWGVVARRSLRGGDRRLRHIRNRMLFATIERELGEAGLSQSEIEEEIARHYPHLLELPESAARRAIA